MQAYDIEFSVDQKREGNLKIRMWLLLALYAATLIGGLIVVFKTVMIALGAIIPLVLYTLILCTWRFVSVEQKYAVDAGSLLIFRKFGSSKPKKVLAVKLKDATKIAPVSMCWAELSNIKAKNVYNAMPSLECKNAYAVIYAEDGVQKAVLLQVIARIQKALRYYNENTVLTELSEIN